MLHIFVHGFYFAYLPIFITVISTALDPTSQCIFIGFLTRVLFNPIWVKRAVTSRDTSLYFGGPVRRNKSRFLHRSLGICGYRCSAMSDTSWGNIISLHHPPASISGVCDKLLLGRYLQLLFSGYKP